jgi:hypothetical protein
MSVQIGYQVPGETVFRWAEATGETLRDAAIALVKKEMWKLGGTVESLHWVSVSLVIPDDGAFARHDQAGWTIFGPGAVAGPEYTHRRARLECVSTGSDDPRMLCPPGEPRTTALQVSVPADTEPGEIDLLAVHA